MAHVSTRGGEPQLFVTSIRGTRQETKVVTSTPIYGTLLAFSVDDRFLLFGDGNDLYRVRADGTSTQEAMVTTRSVEVGPAVSPDGKWLAFRADDTGRLQIYVAPYGSEGRRQQVSRSGGGSPRWTKQGKELCFRNESIWCVAIGPDGSPGSEPQLIVAPKEPFGSWDVSPDGERFYLLRGDIEARQRTAPIQVVVNWFEELRRLVPVQ